MKLNRRGFTKASGMTLLGICGAGCLSTQRGVADIIIYNKTTISKNISITISGFNKKYPQLQKNL
jgi:hypothetical protein